VKILLLDQGNSSLKLGWLEAGRLRFLGRAASHAALDALLPALPDRAWLASVAAPETRSALCESLQSRGIPLCEARVEAHQALLPTRYRPEQLGVDRWLALLASRARGLQPCVVVDAGSATTIDVLDAAGEHLGGYILPGAAMMEQAVLGGTAIRPAAAEGGGQGLPQGTAEAIREGALQSQVALVERVRGGLGDAAPVVLGGGAADPLAARLASPVLRVEQLVLEGLAVLAREEAACAG